MWIVDNVEIYPSTIAKEASLRFRVSRQAIQRHLDGLIADRTLRASGNTRARRYSLRPTAATAFNLKAQGLQEDVVWSRQIAPRMNGVPDNQYRICNYGFTEMLNNAIDHSQSEDIFVRFVRTPTSTVFRILDRGIGIFKKIAREMALDDERHAILELSKGKYTTDPERHSGQGIFFTSRMFDVYEIISGKLFFSRSRSTDDWLLEMRDFDQRGTFISMSLSAKSITSIEQVFDKYSDIERGFTKTHVPLSLAQYGNEQLVSRSQAKRVLTRFYRFEEVFLDFHGVDYIGQAFADEIFRVYRNQNPATRIIATNANAQVQSMIDRATAGLSTDDPRQKHLFPS